MRRILLPVLISLVGILLVFQNQPFDSGRVISVKDGDTIRVRLASGREITVRLIGVNSAELDDRREEVQFLAQMAKRYTFYHLNGREIRLTYDWEPKDRYDRTLAYVWTGGRDLFNETILAEGFASAFLVYPFRKDYQERFRAAEAKARARGAGLWHQGAYPVVAAAQARQNSGMIAAVKFTCASVRAQSRFSLLISAGGEFQAFVPRERLSRFPDLKSLIGRTLVVTGFLEDYRGSTEMRLFFPHQIHTGERPPVMLN